MDFSFILDFIFPKKCVSCGRLGVYLCVDCLRKVEFVEAPICPVCQRQAVEGRTHPGCKGRYTLDGLVVACRYLGPVKRAITKVKYRWVYDIEKVLVGLLAKSLWRYGLPKDLILVPVPLHVKRKRWRGFNQSEILAKTLAKKFGANYADVLFRNRETKTQVGLSRDGRRENVRGAFAIRGSTPEGLVSALGVEPRKTTFRQTPINYFDVGGKNIILIDDVYTSGATMAECAKVLKKAGARSVWGMAVALG